MAQSASGVLTLGELAARFGLTLRGDPQQIIRGVCALVPGKPEHLAFCADARRGAALAQTRAAAVVLAPAAAARYVGNALLAPDPALAFAHIAELFDPEAGFAPGIHPTALIAPDAALGADCHVGPYAVIESGARLGARCFVGAHCVVRANAVLGDDCRLVARVYLGRGCRLGARGRVEPGAVIGSRGFGNVRTRAGWYATPQLGAVTVGDDVEIGANTTIDRGALDDTVIEDGVKLDNQIQIAHNCRIGAHTAIAACVGIAGSTTIGKRCLIGGAAGIGGHLTIADDVVILGRAMVTKSIVQPGVYGSGLPAQPAREWRRLVARVRRLQLFERRLEEIEKRLKLEAPASGVDGGQDDF
jgi:UDP-3-O-[3-hydroxymyristoyl] glucosamine N-acyltransferase